MGSRKMFISLKFEPGTGLRPFTKSTPDWLKMFVHKVSFIFPLLFYFLLPILIIQ